MKKHCIAIVDDDQAIRLSLASVLGAHGFKAQCYEKPGLALAAISAAAPDCVLLDVRMPEIDGMTLQKVIAALPDAPPVIMITGHGDINMAVTAMKNGAHDFIEKPIEDDKLVASIRMAIANNRKGAANTQPANSDLLERLQQLTGREREVAQLVADGYSTAAIASMLEISARTVDHHRASIMAKMQATSLSQLLKLLITVLPMQAEAGKRAAPTPAKK